MLRAHVGLLAFAFWTLLQAEAAPAQWSAQAGDTVRDAFGPPLGDRASVCAA